MPCDLNSCTATLEAVTDAVEGLAEVKGYVEPSRGQYQIFCTFDKYPIGSCVALDECYNRMREVVGLEWTLKLTAERDERGLVVARISALVKYENGK